MSHRVVIVGGGLSGLFVASELLVRGVDDVVVLDASSRPGGVARTIERDGFQLEPGAGTLLLPHPHLSRVLEPFDVDLIPAVDAGMRYVFTRGRLVELPSGPKAALAPLVPWRAKFSAAAEPFRRGRTDAADESLDALLRRRFGDGLGGTLAWVAASGVFAGDPARLSARAAFPGLAELEDAAGSIVRGGIHRLRRRPEGAPRPTSHVPLGGMAALADDVVFRLGDRYRAGFRVEAVRRAPDIWWVEGAERLEADHVVMAVRPSVAGAAIGGELAPIMSRAVSAPVVVVGLGGATADFPLPAGFGALSGPDAGTATLGALFESSYAPHRAPVGSSLVKVIAGGATRPDVVEWDTDRIVEHVGAEVARMLDRNIVATFVEVVRHADGIPQYDVGHGRWMAEVERCAGRLPGLHLTGWAYRGVGVAHLASDATRIAARIDGQPE